MTKRNTTPADAFDLLRRLFACNWEQLADRLGVSSRTLRTWREDGPGETGTRKMRELYRSGLTAAHADWIAKDHDREALLKSLLEHAAEDPADPANW